ncbi:Cys-tRNA(Pro) deacylase [Oceanobacillus indicireducens]|uniref:Cys-tRNA(Pro)/Cys-tRNA(Cys) deacylase n=1 Tax=Oceanobacillus indicireducens TaxID=1004261 RepID=A0A917XR96_9BACI|nr:Cys-tRNA(Pro) deacylase [Oceanobacillus indicireducens]GGN48524.1 Cys-tRNA(Pro)/Cys-tRNA(Cys) deacylase [Oceanobacillus indicireducens]
MRKTNVHRLLDKEKIAYQIHEYAWKEDSLDAETAASQTNIPLDRVFKTLVTVGDKTGPVVVVISAQDELNLKKLAKVSGNKKIDMLPMKDLEKTTGYIRGGCSPIGMKKSYPTYIDSYAEGLEYLVISAGKRGSQVELSPADLKEMTKAAYADLRAE